jgi:hypothetical protein
VVGEAGCANSACDLERRLIFYHGGDELSPCVMAGLGPVIHDFNPLIYRKSWVAGPSPAMTRTRCSAWLEKDFLHPPRDAEFSHSLEGRPSRLAVPGESRG